jgi:hypothetical protein
MTVKLSSLKADIKREREGDWVKYPDFEGVEFHVRAITTPEYQTRVQREAVRLATKYGEEGAPIDESARIMGKILAEELLLGWKGFDAEYTPEYAQDILSDPAYRDMRQAVEWCATRLARTKVEFVEEASKN